MSTSESPRYLPWKRNLSHGELPIPFDTEAGEGLLFARDYLEEEARHAPENSHVKAVAIATIFQWGYDRLEGNFEFSEVLGLPLMTRAFVYGGWLTDASLQSLKAYFYQETPTERFGVEWDSKDSYGELLEEAAAYLLWVGHITDGDAPSFSFKHMEVRDIDRDEQLRRCLLEGGVSVRGHILNRWSDRKLLLRRVEAEDEYDSNRWTGDSTVDAEPSPTHRNGSMRFWKAREGVYLDGVNPGPDRSQNYSYWKAAGESEQEKLAEVISRSFPERLYGLSMTEDDKLRWALEPEMEERANRRFYFAFASENRFWPENRVRNWLLYAFFRDAGIPASQVLGLQVSDVDFETCTVPVVNKRSGERSLRPLPDHVVDGLRAYLDGPWTRGISRVGSDGDGPLFTVNSGGSLAQGYLDTFLRSTGEAEIGKRVSRLSP